jgi:hypothetical protein
MVHEEREREREREREPHFILSSLQTFTLEPKKEKRKKSSQAKDKGHNKFYNFKLALL